MTLQADWKGVILGAANHYFSPSLICWAFFSCNMKQGWTWLFLYVWIILRFSFRSGQDWDFRTKVQNSCFKAKKGRGVDGGLICIHTCTYERVYLYVHAFRTGNHICKLDLVILCNKRCSIRSNSVCVWEREREWSGSFVNLHKLTEWKRFKLKNSMLFLFLSVSSSPKQYTFVNLLQTCYS